MGQLADKIKKILNSELGNVKKYGVDHIGYRYFLPDGRSFGCPTINKWDETERTEEFYQAMKECLSDELVKLHANQFSYVTRSMEHRRNKYLEWMQKLGLQNSIGIYRFGNDRVDSFFFILDESDGERRDLLINNIQQLEGCVNSLSKKMDALHKRKELLETYELIIDKDVITKIFPNKTKRQKYADLIIDGKMISLTKRELDILLLIGQSNSNKGIAQALDISEKTVEKYIAGLKRKFCVNSKNELANCSKMPQVVFWSKK